MEFVLIFFITCNGRLINRFKVVKIVGTLVVDTFVDDKELAAFDWRK